MIEELKADANERMEKTVEALTATLGRLRTGRAHPGILDGVMVDYYGNSTPLRQVSYGELLIVTMNTCQKAWRCWICAPRTTRPRFSSTRSSARASSPSGVWARSPKTAAWASRAAM